MAVINVVGSNFAFDRYTFDYCCSAMSRRDIDTIELWGIASHLNLFAQDLSGETERVRSCLEKWSLSVRCVTPEQVIYPVNIAASDEQLRTQSIEYFRRAAIVAERLASPYLFLTSGWGLEDEPETAAWNRSLSSLREIVDFAESRGVRCLIEPLQRGESNVVNTVDDVVRMLSEIGNDTVGVTLDTVAVSANGDSVNSYVTRLGSRIRHIQVVDGSPTGHLAWGDGDLPLDTWLKELTESDIEASLTFEPFGDGRYALNPESVWDKGLPHVRRWLPHGSH